MAVAASFQRGDGVITGRSAASGIASSITYSGTVAWVLGGVGNHSFSAKAPERPFPADTFIEHAAPLFSPCTVTVAPNGTVRLFVTEEYGISDCQ